MKTCMCYKLGVLEANFIEPAHDKQDFERTTILARLEARLVQMQKSYWLVSVDNLKRGNFYTANNFLPFKYVRSICPIPHCFLQRLLNFPTFFLLLCRNKEE